MQRKNAPANLAQPQNTKDFVLKAIKGKGHGMIAMRNFKKGEKVSMGCDVLMRMSESDSLAEVYRNASLEDKLAFLALANQMDPKISELRTAALISGAGQHNGSMKEVESIWDTNCYSREEHRHEVTVIYRMGSRFNHSCVPNCEIEDGDFDDETETFLQIQKPVKSGEELVVTYLPDETAEDDLCTRRSYLWEGWGFHCECTKCSKEARKEKCGCIKCAAEELPDSDETSSNSSSDSEVDDSRRQRQRRHQKPPSIRLPGAGATESLHAAAKFARGRKLGVKTVLVTAGGL